MLKLLHTADWHLGRRFRSFPEDGALKLSRARLEVLDRILLTADRYAVDAVLCAGDLFDEPNPAAEWWEQTAARLRKCPSTRPVFLLPGNHDPLTTESIWAKGHKFRSLLPDWVHVVDREDFQHTFPTAPCSTRCPACRKPASATRPNASRSVPPATSASASAWSTAAPSTPRTGRRTFRSIATRCSSADSTTWPSATRTASATSRRAASTRRRSIRARRKPTAFDEKDPGCVAVVFINRQRVATVRPERVARWTWEECTVTSIDELRALVRRTDLADRVLRLHVNMKVPAPEYDEAEVLLEELQGTPARHARAGVLELDRNGLELETATVDQHCGDLPDVLRSAVTRLKRVAENDPAQRLVAERALFHLYRSAKRKAS